MRSSVVLEKLVLLGIKSLSRRIYCDRVRFLVRDTFRQLNEKLISPVSSAGSEQLVYTQ